MRKRRMPARSRCRKISCARTRRVASISRTRRVPGYNRGILRFDDRHTPVLLSFSATESDFREAIRLLEPLAGRPADPVPSLELARAYNNLANLLALDDTRLAEARRLYEAAIRRDEELVKAEPANRVYKMELADVLQQPLVTFWDCSVKTISRRQEAGRRSICWMSWRCRRPRSASNRPTRTTCAAGC